VVEFSEEANETAEILFYDIFKNASATWVYVCDICINLFLMFTEYQFVQPGDLCTYSKPWHYTQLPQATRIGWIAWRAV
jgi:hypothetical protein